MSVGFDLRALQCIGVFLGMFPCMSRFRFPGGQPSGVGMTVVGYGGHTPLPEEKRQHGYRGLFLTHMCIYIYIYCFNIYIYQ